MPYCEPTDVVLGNIPVPRFMTIEDQVNKASDEIDATVGQVYTLPLNLSLGSPDALLLKKVNSDLAAGRIILSAAGGGEDTRLHNYGIYLVREAQKTLSSILSGATILETATKIVRENEAKFSEFVQNKDSQSFVEGFYSSNGTAAGLGNHILPGVSQDGYPW